ncbi:phage tail tube protein, partial [Escherichia coli]|nr:phage tail tube protein [Escherichia coli]
WDALNVYCSNGWVEIDNNIAENALRGVAVGRKNWMFAGSDSGGEHAAVLYSLIGTCRLNNVEPEKWLRYVIEHIQDWPATCYFKIDGQQLSLTGGIEVPMNRTVNDDIIGLDGSVDRKETHRAPYVKGTFKVPKNFPVSKITSSDEMTITAELANGQVYVLSSAWLHGEANHNAEEGTVDLEFHGEEGDYQ